MTVHDARATRLAAPVIHEDGTIYARCPRCGTVGTSFRPEPGAYILQKCPRGECKMNYAVYVWPHWMELVTGPPVDVTADMA